MLNYCQIQVVECLFYLDNFPVMSNLNNSVLFNYCKSSKNHNRNIIHLKRIIYCQLSVFAHCLNQHFAHMFQCARMLCVRPNCTLMSLSIFTHSRRHTTAWQTQTRIVVSWMQTVTIRRAGLVSGAEMAMPNDTLLYTLSGECDLQMRECVFDVLICFCACVIIAPSGSNGVTLCVCPYSLQSRGRQSDDLRQTYGYGQSLSLP